MSKSCVVMHHVSVVDTGHIFRGNLFCPSDLSICSVFYFSLLALRDNNYFYAGQLIAMSILHGRPSPNLFSSVLSQAVAAGADGVQADIGDIHDPETESCVLEVKGYTAKM